MRIGGSRHKCVSCDREVASFFPVPVGGTTVCACCLAVMVNDNGVLRIASDAEADKPSVQRALQSARWIRKLFPPKVVL